MSEFIQIEARLNDLISRKFKQMEDLVSGSSKRLKGSTDGLTRSTVKMNAAASSAKKGITQLAARFGPAAVIVGTLTLSVMKLNQGLKFVDESTKAFEKTMSNVKALLPENSTKLDELTEKAKEFGASTVFSATQSGQAFVELRKLGFEANEILASTEDILNLAAAANTELAEASKVTASVMRAYGLEATDVEHLTDVMALAFSNSALDLEKFSISMRQVAPVAKTFGFSVEETTALLASLSDAGFDASQSGTATRNILLNLADSSGALAKKLGGSVDSFEELIPALIKLREDGVDLNETLQLTDKRSVAAFNRFLDGAESTELLAEKLRGADGDAKRMATTMLDNVAGATTLLESAQEGLAIAIGESFSSEKKERIKRYADMVSTATEAVEDNRETLILLGADFNKVMTMMAQSAFESTGIIVKQFQNIFITIKVVQRAYSKLNFLATKHLGGSEEATKKAADQLRVFSRELDTLVEQRFIDPEALRRLKEAEEALKKLKETAKETNDSVDSDVDPDSLGDGKKKGTDEVDKEALKRREDHENMMFDLMVDRSKETEDFIKESNKELIALEKDKAREDEAISKKLASDKEKIAKKAIRLKELNIRTEKRGNEALTDSLISEGSRGLQALVGNEKAAKRIAMMTSVIQGIVAVQRALANPPGPPATIPGAVAIGIKAAANTAVIASQAFQDGGLPSGRNAIIKVNEEGQESVLNARATTGLGVGGVNALNAGQTIQRNVTNEISYSPTIQIGESAPQDVVNMLRQDIDSFARFFKSDVVERGYLNG